LIRGISLIKVNFYKFALIGTVIAILKTLHNRFDSVPVADLPDWTLPSVSLNLWRSASQVFFAGYVRHGSCNLVM
jgi:hypothetical protein